MSWPDNKRANLERAVDVLVLFVFVVVREMQNTNITLPSVA
jgi:hypothetical protein